MITVIAVLGKGTLQSNEIKRPKSQQTQKNRIVVMGVERIAGFIWAGKEVKTAETYGESIAMKSNYMKILEICKWLLQPESSEDLPLSCSSDKGTGARVVKTLFWFMVAVSTGILISRLAT